MEMIEKLVATLSGIVWGAPMLVLLVGTGLYLTIILKGMQFWALPHAMKLIFHKEHDGEGEISHFAALMTALAATVGIGNIVGVATAITLGGPGAVFWMWMTGLVGMATKYSEAVLAVKYRQRGHHHGFKGGPMYYLTYGLNMPKLGMAFAIFTAIAAFGIGNMTQANAVAQILSSEMAIPTWVTGVVLLTLTAVVILGGIKSIGNFTSFLVPFMIVAYVSVSLVILAMNLDKLGDAFSLIFYHAFNPIAAGGGFVGATMAAAIRYGVARGVFSNESGLGSAPIAAAAAKTNDPVRQALVSMTQTFIDTLVVCTMTALIILISPFWQQGISPSALTMQSFQLYLGSFGGVVVIISTVLFAYSTILGWSYYGEKAFEYIFGERFIRLYRVLFIAGVMVGSMLKLEFVWNFSDLTNGLMAIPNLIALLLLSRVISSESKRYFESLK
ncbi:alanine/glycine:cation symporter family protein [Sulfurospirillum arsenophilum]|uniref:alanine/glycine:cation symporter family protein n=1 Tax=Sulfurospirillum arsenophilum TaxID=56698 RepID=UPI0005A7E423|nr:sodium:alanine symporter family protein [Sulfurospirillum arsenophilum]